MHRRRRFAVIAAACGAAVAVVAVPLLAFTLDGKDRAQSPLAPAPSSRTTSGSPAPDPVREGFIPDDFPLEAGWPDSATADGEGLHGPSRDLPPLEFSACDHAFEEPDHIERLRADWSSAEDFRARQLTMYASVEPAIATVDGLIDLYRGCGTGPLRDDGYRTEYEVVELDPGDQAWAILQRDTFEGAESPFGQTTIVIRVATGVLILDHGGHAGYPRGDGRDAIATMLDEAAEPIAAMPGLQERLDDGAADPDAADDPDLAAPADTTTVPEDFPLGVHLDEGAESATQVNGPDRYENGVFSTLLCDDDMAAISRLSGSRLGYGEVYEGAGYHGRALRAYATVQDAIDELDRLRAQLAGCPRDRAHESTAERVWRVFDPVTGYDEVTFGHTVEGETSGGLYTVVRVGNAVLVLNTSGEHDADSLAPLLTGHRNLVDALAPAMCIFTEVGC